jgi:hypothetical protein
MSMQPQALNNMNVGPANAMNSVGAAVNNAAPPPVMAVAAAPVMASLPTVPLSQQQTQIGSESQVLDRKR